MKPASNPYEPNGSLLKNSLFGLKTKAAQLKQVKALADYRKRQEVVSLDLPDLENVAGLSLMNPHK